MFPSLLKLTIVSMPNQKPHQNTYWVIPGRLLAGEYPGHPNEALAWEKLCPFLDCGVDRFLDLTGPRELAPYSHLLDRWNDLHQADIRHSRHWIDDMGTPDSAEEMQAIQRELQQWLKNGHCVYVHCWGGIGRTGTVIGCHLVEQGLSGSEALIRMAELWQGVSLDKRRRYPLSPQTREQEAYVRNWIPVTTVSRNP